MEAQNLSDVFSGAKSIGNVYDIAKKNGVELGIKVNKTFLVPKELVYIEEGHNIRDIDHDHVEMFRQAYEADKPVPALYVTIQPKGFRVEEGHHRKLAGDQVEKLTHFELKLVNDDPAEIAALMITTSQGKPLTTMQRAKAYLRLANLGKTSQEIADIVGRSRPDVEQHLMLMKADDKTIQAIESGEVKFTTAIQAIRQHGTEAGKVLEKAVQEAKASGKKKLTAESMKSFGKLDYAAVMKELNAMDQSLLPQNLQTLLRRYNEAQPKKASENAEA